MTLLTKHTFGHTEAGSCSLAIDPDYPALSTEPLSVTNGRDYQSIQTFSSSRNQQPDCFMKSGHEESTLFYINFGLSIRVDIDTVVWTMDMG